MNSNITAREWFALGERIPYDSHAKRILGPDEPANSPNVLQVFRRVAGNDARVKDAVWTTFLPGFPDGSFGWAGVEPHLAEAGLGPTLYVEYVGQGDSDKPAGYNYSTMERADLVEAMWRASGVKTSFVVAFDYSSMVLLELLSRRLERLENGSHPGVEIPRVLIIIINGGLFADAHSHPWLTTPLLKTPLGRVGAVVAQRSKFVFNQMVKVLFSKEYNATSEELRELYEAIRRRNGAAFMSRAAGFVDEHKAQADRWDLRRLFLALRGDVSFHVAGSEEDPFEPKQIVKARERLGSYGLDIRKLPGGHLTTSEHPELIAELIGELRRRTRPPSESYPCRPSLITSRAGVS